MFNIPESSLPECLKDENRINVLFAPIRNRSVNPKDWDHKISSWKTIIKVYCEKNDVYTFTLPYLNKIFVRSGRPPSCLSDVLKEMEKSGEVQSLDIFLRKSSRTWSGWASDLLVKRPLSWSYNKLKDSLLTTDNSQQVVVHVEVIQLKVDELINSIPDNYKNKLISLKDLLQICNNTTTNLEHLKLLIHYMSNQNIVDVTYLTNKQNELETTLIKFSDGATSSIVDLDISVYRLEQNEKLIIKGIEEMEDNIQHCINEAKMHLSKNHRQMAKSSLRKKRDIEKALEKKAQALHNVQTLLQQIQETHTNAHVWESYKNILSTFDSTYKEAGMSEDLIDDTMIKLGEVIDKNQDIHSALARTSDDFNDSDLEEELADLLKDEPHDPPNDNGQEDTTDIENKLSNVSLNLPEVPDLSPNVSKELQVNTQ